MLKRALTYFALMLIVLQSALAMGDAHQLYQSGTQHVAFDDTHQLDNAKTTQNQHSVPDKPDSSQWDCHHCCHCHSHFCPAILVSAELLLQTKASSSVPDYAENALPDTHETFLRPPKA